jgi:predicted dehydrogenase
LLNSLKIPGINFVAVADIWPYSQKYAVNILKKVQAEPDALHRLSGDARKREEPGCVIIATPDWMHAPATIDSLRAGKHVYCEKEMSNTLEGARKMVEAQRETGKLLQIGHQRRSNPRYWHSYELINKEEVLGRMTHFYGQWNRPKAFGAGLPQRPANQRRFAEALRLRHHGAFPQLALV